MLKDIRPKGLAALKEIAELLNSTNDMEDMLSEVLEKLLEVTGFRTGWIILLNETADNFIWSASRSLPPSLEACGLLSMCSENCWCVERYKASELDHAVNVPLCLPIVHGQSSDSAEHHHEITHHATAPLKAGNERYGLLNVAEAGKRHFSDEELSLLQSVALQIGTAIKRIRLYQAQRLNAIHYAKLSDVIQGMNAIAGSEELPVEAVRLIGETFGWPHVSLFIHEQDELSLRASYTDGKVRKEWKKLRYDDASPINQAFRSNELTVISKYPDACTPHLAELGMSPYKSAVAIPLRIRNRPYGALFASSPTHCFYDEYNADFMHSLGDHFTLSIENLRVYEQQKELAKMEERNRMARDLHDSVIQKVFSLSFIAKGAERLLGDGSPVVSSSLQEIGRLSQEALKEMRALIWQLHPPGLEDGVLSALKQYGRSIGMTVYEEVSGVIKLPRAIEEAFWRIGQEALNNVKKHSGVDVAHIKLAKRQSNAVIEISNNGKAMEAASSSDRMTLGLTSMRERAEALGGRLMIESGNGRRTTVRAIVPIERKDDYGKAVERDDH